MLLYLVTRAGTQHGSGSYSLLFLASWLLFRAWLSLSRAKEHADASRRVAVGSSCGPGPLFRFWFYMYDYIPIERYSMVPLRAARPGVVSGRLQPSPLFRTPRRRARGRRAANRSPNDPIGSDCGFIFHVTTANFVLSHPRRGTRHHDLCARDLFSIYVMSQKSCAHTRQADGLTATVLSCESGRSLL